MKNITSAFFAALTGARDKGLVPRRFVWITGKDLASGAPASIGLWTGDDDINIRSPRVLQVCRRRGLTMAASI